MKNLVIVGYRSARNFDEVTVANGSVVANVCLTEYVVYLKNTEIVKKIVLQSVFGNIIPLAQIVLRPSSVANDAIAWPAKFPWNADRLL